MYDKNMEEGTTDDFQPLEDLTPFVLEEHLMTKRCHNKNWMCDKFRHWQMIVLMSGITMKSITYGIMLLGYTGMRNAQNMGLYICEYHTKS
jgi:hypothetical protein